MKAKGVRYFSWETGIDAICLFFCYTKFACYSWILDPFRKSSVCGAYYACFVLTCLRYRHRYINYVSPFFTQTIIRTIDECIQRHASFLKLVGGSLQLLPFKLNRCENLTALDLSGNSLSVLPLATLTNLRYVCVCFFVFLCVLIYAAWASACFVMHTVCVFACLCVHVLIYAYGMCGCLFVCFKLCCVGKCLFLICFLHLRTRVWW